MTTVADQVSRFTVQSRFVLCMVVVLGAIGLRIAGLLLDPSFVQVVIWVSGIFVTGDVSAAWVGGKAIPVQTVEPKS